MHNQHSEEITFILNVNSEEIFPDPEADTDTDEFWTHRLVGHKTFISCFYVYCENTLFEKLSTVHFPAKQFAKGLK